MLNTKNTVTTASAIAVCLFIGTTSFMSPQVYTSKCWFVFWVAIAFSLIFLIVKRRMWRQPCVFVLHLSFILILCGGGASALTATRGSIHLSQGETYYTFTDSNGNVLQLPVGIELISFSPEYYAGMNFPSDFHTKIRTTDDRSFHISMNNIAVIDGWRFYQSSYDNSGGSILLVSNDPAGIPLTYTGYALFALSGLWLLIRQRGKRKAGVALLLTVTFHASAAPAIPDSSAMAIEDKTVIFQGREVPFVEMADAFTQKIVENTTCGRLSATRFVASLSMFPQDWAEVPFVKIKGNLLKKELGADDDYISPKSLYDSTGVYIPQKFFGISSNLDKEILYLDEKIALLTELWDGRFFYPSDSELSPLQTAIHKYYVLIKPWKWFFIVVFLAAFLSISSKLYHIGPVVGGVFGAITFVWNWIVGGRVPLANSPEVILFTSVVLCWLSVFCSKYGRTVTFFILLTTACLALVGWLGIKTPVFTPVMPVLSSPWLGAHVALIMLGYALLVSTFALSVAYFLSSGTNSGLSIITLNLTYYGTYVLGLGIFLGAMWANVSWGRYWAWDPKETWALVTLLLYAIPLHQSTGFRQSPRAFHTYLLFAIFSILMTYFGVNYLPSLHAYS